MIQIESIVEIRKLLTFSASKSLTVGNGGHLPKLNSCPYVVVLQININRNMSIFVTKLRSDFIIFVCLYD